MRMFYNQKIQIFCLQLLMKYVIVPFYFFQLFSYLLSLIVKNSKLYYIFGSDYSLLIKYNQIYITFYQKKKKNELVLFYWTVPALDFVKFLRTPFLRFIK